jgi:protein-S-isoprenylcysteine O-methyltransferase Ste14
MTRWIVPAVFLAAAAATGAHAAHTLIYAVAHPSARPVLVAVYAVLKTFVALAFAAFTVRRTEPQRRSRDFSAFAACTVAMLAVVIVSAPSSKTPPSMLVAGEAVAVCGCVWMLASVLVLGRCFGVLPEARGLVTRGPYRFVRHPVYVGEITALVGLTLAAPAIWNLVVLAFFISAQTLRMRLEERALTEAFPDYAAYAQQTGRLLPALRQGEPGPQATNVSSRRLVAAVPGRAVFSFRRLSRSGPRRSSRWH